MKNKNTEAVYHIYVIIQYKVTGWPLGPWSRHKLPIMSSEQPCVWFVARPCRDWKLQNTFRPRKQKRDTKTRLNLLFREILSCLAWSLSDTGRLQPSAGGQNQVHIWLLWSGPRDRVSHLTWGQVIPQCSVPRPGPCCSVSPRVSPLPPAPADAGSKSGFELNLNKLLLHKYLYFIET